MSFAELCNKDPIYKIDKKIILDLSATPYSNIRYVPIWTVRKLLKSQY